MADLTPPRNRKELYERIARGGKDEVILEEMVRLGFWPNTAAAAGDPPDEIRRMARAARCGSPALRKQAQGLRNLAQLEIDLKKQRMAESKRRRELNKQKLLGERAAAKAETQQKKTRELTYLGPRVSRPASAPSRIAASPTSRSSPPQKLPVANTAAELAAAMKLPLGQLRFLAFSREVSTTSHYHRFTIPKKTGGERVISAPHKRLKAAQHWILQHVLEPLALAEQRTASSPAARPSRNALPHVGAAIVVNVDLKDFFPTVTYRRVKGLFKKLGYSEEVATVLGLVCSEPDITETELDGTTLLRRARPAPPAARRADEPRDHERAVPPPRSPHRRLGREARLHVHALRRRPHGLDEGSQRAGRQHARVPAQASSTPRASPSIPTRCASCAAAAARKSPASSSTRSPACRATSCAGSAPCSTRSTRTAPPARRGATSGDVLEAALGFASYVAMVDPARGAPAREGPRAPREVQAVADGVRNRSCATCATTVSDTV